MNNNFKNNPNLKYRCDIVGDSSANFQIFEVFISYKDHKEYLASPNINNFNIDIYTLFDNKKILSLVGHENEINSIKYFINNKYHKEYLVSVEEKEIIIVWDITHNYNLKYKINNGCQGKISCCILIFPHNLMNDFIAECTTLFEKNNTRLYSLDNVELIKEFNNSEKYPIYDLISWYNKENNEYYIIQIGLMAIIVCNLLLDDEIYFEFKITDRYIFHKGFLYEKDENDYLVSLSIYGQIIILDLYSLTIVKKLDILRENTDLCGALKNCILWNNKYIILNFQNIPFFYIYDLEEDKFISKIAISLNCQAYIKRIYLPTFRESLLIRDKRNIIKLWSI